MVETLYNRSLAKAIERCSLTPYSRCLMFPLFFKLQFRTIWNTKIKKAILIIYERRTATETANIVLDCGKYLARQYVGKRPAESEVCNLATTCCTNQRVPILW